MHEMCWLLVEDGDGNWHLRIKMGWRPCRELAQMLVREALAVRWAMTGLASDLRGLVRERERVGVEQSVVK